MSWCRDSLGNTRILLVLVNSSLGSDSLGLEETPGGGKAKAHRPYREHLYCSGFWLSQDRGTSTQGWVHLLGGKFLLAPSALAY